MKEVNLRQPKTIGLDLFLNILLVAKPNLCKNIILKLSDFIISSGCIEIEFRKMSSRAMGISKTDICVLNSDVLLIPDEYTLYIILHEISHQYQYKKYGKNIALDIYLDTIDLETAAKKLLAIEQVADRLAIAKLNSILKLNKPIVPRYLGITDLAQIKNHLQKIRSEVKELGLSTIEEINDHIQNSI